MRPLSLAALAAALVAAAAPAADPVVVAKPDAFPTLVNPAGSRCKDEAKRLHHEAVGRLGETEGEHLAQPARGKSRPRVAPEHGEEAQGHGGGQHRSL